jgi:hypothetical protein
MLRHPRHARILASLAGNTVVSIIDLLLWHVTTLGNTALHAAVIGREGGDVFGRVGDFTSVDTILIAGWFWSIEASLEQRSAMLCHVSGNLCLTWIKFFPSGLVTSGCNLGVVKV